MTGGKLIVISKAIWSLSKVFNIFLMFDMIDVCSARMDIVQRFKPDNRFKPE
jgi:hypothetical protein